MNQFNKKIIGKDGPQKVEKNIAKMELKTVENGQSKLDFRKYTKQIWLAGLGAFSKAEEEGSKLFESLVQTGAELEAKSTEVTDHNIGKISGKAKNSVIETREKIEKLVDYGVNQSLNKLGLATVADLQKLENLVLDLHEKIDIMMEENKVLKNNIKEK